MPLSYRIPIITGIILLLTAIVNISAFQIVSDRYFDTYVGEVSIKETDYSLDPERLGVLLQIGKLDIEDQTEYLSILTELSNLSDSISNIGINPELYISRQNASGDSMITLPIKSEKNTIFPTFNITAFGEDTTEGRFVTSVVRDILVINILWLILVLMGYFLWIRSIFRPIDIITTTIQNIIDRKKYGMIRYSVKNEFEPLISTINSLHTSLSIQEKIRADFLSDLSHEIRTPITAVQCYLEAFEDGAMRFDAETLPLLQNELKRLTSITGKILDFESFTHDMFDEVSVERFAPKEITEEIISEYTPQLQKTSQSISHTLTSQMYLTADRGMYVQVLHNIFSNFIKYAGPHTRLDISLTKTAKDTILEFSDDGYGIPEKEMLFVKEKFYRVDKARTASDKSMGIGLSIIDRIARLHRGGLTVEKNTPKGVKFLIRFSR